MGNLEQLIGKEELDILFVLPWFGTESGHSFTRLMSAEFPFSIAMLMAYIEKQGFKTAVLDMYNENKPLEILEQSLKELRPKIVGLSAFSANMVNAETVAKNVKEFNQDIPVILGGFHATAEPEECLTKYKGFDYVMYGESEQGLAVLIEKLLNQEPVGDTPNLVYKNGDKLVVNPEGPIIANMDELPFPLISKFNVFRYMPSPPNYHSLPSIGLMSARGCPYKCTFCATHFQRNKRVRRMSRGLLVDWIEKIISDYGIRDFRFYDDTFTIPLSVVREFCEEVLKRNLKIHWNCYSRVDTIDEPIARLMKQAGCYHIKFGIEAGTEKTLKRIRKNITLEQAIKAIAVVKRCGIETKASFMLGIHDETFEDSKKQSILHLNLLQTTQLLS